MIKSKDDYNFFLAADLASSNIKKWKFYYKYTHEIAHYQRLLRKVEYYNNCKKNPISKVYLIILKLYFRRESIKFGFTIPLNVFDAGLSIAHYGSIVVNGGAKVGKNCRIHSATNIGALNGHYPEIGNNVYIGPGVKIFGKVKVGDNVTIGANSVVNKDIESNVTVVGIPAKVISFKGSESLLLDGYNIAKVLKL